MPLEERHLNSTKSNDIAKGGVAVPFPWRLHECLAAMEREGRTNVVSWLPHGRAFMVHKQKEFTEDIMPRFFGQTKYASFQRQLNLYSFSRFAHHTKDKGAYYHLCFVKDHAPLVRQMVRRKIKGTKVRRALKPSEEPDFYLPDWKHHFKASYPPSLRCVVGLTAATHRRFPMVPPAPTKSSSTTEKNSVAKVSPAQQKPLLILPRIEIAPALPTVSFNQPAPAVSKNLTSEPVISTTAAVKVPPSPTSSSMTVDLTESVPETIDLTDTPDVTQSNGTPNVTMEAHESNTAIMTFDLTDSELDSAPQEPAPVLEVSSASSNEDEESIMSLEGVLDDLEFDQSGNLVLFDGIPFDDDDFEKAKNAVDAVLPSNASVMSRISMPASVLMGLDSTTLSLLGGLENSNNSVVVMPTEGEVEADTLTVLALDSINSNKANNHTFWSWEQDPLIDCLTTTVV